MFVVYGSENPFFEAWIRRKFIMKVFSIVMSQLVFVTGVISFCIFYQPVRHFLWINWWISLICIVVEFAIIFTIICTSYGRRYPYNILLLILFTLVSSLVLGSVSAAASTFSVALALGICILCCTAVIIFAMTTDRDLTSCLGLLVLLTIVFIAAGLMIWLVPPTTAPLVHKIFSGIGALIFMMYLAVDIQMLMGGKKLEMSPEDYVYASLRIYLDISNVFLGILGVVR